MFFNIPVVGKTIAKIIDPNYAELQVDIQIAQGKAYVVGQKPDTLFQDLNTIKNLLMTKLKQKFKDRYSEITIDVSQ